MRPIKKLILVALALLISSCSNDENEAIDQINKTSLFNKVITPEVNEDSSSEASLEAFSSSDVPSLGSRSHYPTNEIEPGILTAGEWSDLNNWEFWKSLIDSQVYIEGVNKWNLKETKRYSFQVYDTNKSPVANAEIKLLVNQTTVWKTKTDNTGKATLWSNLEFNQLTASITIKDTKEIVTSVKEHSQGINEIKLNKTIANKKIIDIYFAIDTTGSMGDEIDYLKAELNYVIESIKKKSPLVEMRLGAVFYRDKGDEYITRNFSFTENETNLVSFIKEQSANGGGDFPEAVHDALDVAISQNSWNDDASSRIIFLLLDAPPHYTQEVISSLEKNLIKAAEQGIKIIPISASGIDKATEYLMRSFAILTNGTYVFITDDSRIGNPHITPTIGDYEVQKLNELLIHLVDQYIP
ncbi:vWA domain-containing protein [Aquimarina agarilytica]|uniref:vWA domain-containing protein n=1 Tax=Aquimarina agarilytica TaxID=1087449 RepID=UPI000288B7BE|nr:vWA domain-containing protein [Aquimarina agarilytica]